jgi:phosphatidylglycerophosphate synthase
VTSRAATDELLAGLRAGRWRPPAWARFAALSAGRSVQQARTHPRALAELTALHAVFAVLAGRPGRRWTAVSWLLAVSHLGMLEARPSLGLPSAVTMLRANLPAIWRGPQRWLPAVALASDLADGRLARRTGGETPFGAQADALADAAFWTWFVIHHEPSRRVRTAALAAWAAPVAMVTAGSIQRGRMLDAPRPVMLRPAAAMQAIIAVRTLVRPGPAFRIPEQRRRRATTTSRRIRRMAGWLRRCRPAAG